MTQDQQAEIRLNGEAPVPGTPAERKWYKIWDILFPGQPYPASPYEVEFVERFERVARSFVKRGGIESFLKKREVRPEFYGLLSDFLGCMVDDVRRHPAEEESSGRRDMAFADGQPIHQTRTFLIGNNHEPYLDPKGNPQTMLDISSTSSFTAPLPVSPQQPFRGDFDSFEGSELFDFERYDDRQTGLSPS